jgi:hypothetical protein
VKFKELKQWDRFEFASKGEWYALGLEKGPWIKLSKRLYTKETIPFSPGRMECFDHQFWCRKHNEVGTINVEVTKL